MKDREREDNATSGHSQPIDPPVPDEQKYQLERDPSAPRDVGRTSGGGSLGHTQPDKVEREAPLRNNAEERKSDEPTMPSKESTANTKI